MRTFILFLIAGCLAGCAARPTPPTTVIASDAPESAPGAPAQLSPDQIAQLKSRLDRLKVGMSRSKVLEILELDSFGVHSFAHANTTGMVYRFGNGDVLELGLQPGNYDYTLRWAKFDGEVWPQNWAPKPKTATKP